MKGLWKNKKYQQKLNGNMEMKSSNKKVGKSLSNGGGINKKKPIFPDEAEIERITKHFSDPNCKEINIGLKPNASELDKAKYGICQSISRYKRVNKLTPKELGKKIGINQEKTDDILFGRINNLNFEELASYTEKLAGHLEVKINYDGEKASAKAW